MVAIGVTSCSPQSETRAKPLCRKTFLYYSQEVTCKLQQISKVVVPVIPTGMKDVKLDIHQSTLQGYFQILCIVQTTLVIHRYFGLFPL